MKKILLFIVLAFAGIFLMACGDSGEENIAEVNGDTISHEDYNKYYEMIKREYEIQNLGSGAGEDADVELDEKKDKDTIKNLKQRAFDALVLKQLVKQEAASRGLQLSDEELEKGLSNFKDSAFGNQTDNYEKFLQELGIDEGELRKEIGYQMLSKKLQQEICTDITVSEEELKSFYDENLESFKEMGGIHISHILVDTEEKARDILVKISEGEDFSELAREYSSCASSKQGGYLQVVNEGSRLAPEFKEAALKLKPGEITQQPVKSSFGYHIIKAGEREESRTIPFEEAKNQIKLYLKNNKDQQAYSDYLKELHGGANIKDYR